MGSENINQRWVDAVKNGSRLLFWVVLISVLVRDISITALPWLGLGREYIKWVELVCAPAGLIGLFGILALTAPVRLHTDHGVFPDVRRLLRVFAVLEVAGRFWMMASKQIPDLIDPFLAWIGETVTHTLVVYLLFTHLRFIARRFGQARFAAVLSAMAWVGAITSAFLSISFSALFRDLGFSLQTYQTFLYVRMSLRFVVWVVALAILRKFANSLQSTTEARCLVCGYRVHGLTDPRCPECGTPFVLE